MVQKSQMPTLHGGDKEDVGGVTHDVEDDVRAAGNNVGVENKLAR